MYSETSPENEGAVENLEQELSVGVAYEQLVEKFAGRPIDPDLLNVPPESGFLLSSISESAEKNISNLPESTAITNPEVGVLDDFSSRATRKEFDTSKWRIERSGLVPVIYMPSNDYGDLTRGSQAITVNKITSRSYIVIPEYEDKDDVFNAHHLEEQRLHETHHVVWKAAMREGLIPNNETTPDTKTAYAMFQNELLAKCVSEGALGGYTHVPDLRPDSALQKFLQRGAENMHAHQQSTEINELLQDHLEPLLQRKGLQKKILIRRVMNATSFEELQVSLQQIESTIQRAPDIAIPEKKISSNGWDTI